ncbi:hypothetical protein [Dongia sedimenti]|uniref:Uncharacterized protein n=1 Tax=Dongia sedimenti TaxID=3064282 RepID=A0ABU0YV63_9PROT|nr:hypothetical protein [Rhodospirillaceae bacterium R-7]
MLSMFGRGEEPKSPMKPGSAPVPAARPANTNGPTLRAPAPSGKARNFENPPSVGQYLVHLASDIRSFTRAEISGTVVGATPAEVQRLARLAAKLKSRYFAQALDLTSTEHGPISEADIRYLERSRFMYEEVERALDSLRHAIQIGDLALEGLKRD